MKAYLGDGVYAVVDGPYVKLTTEDGVRVIHEIYLDRGVIKNLLEFLRTNQLRGN